MNLELWEKALSKKIQMKNWMKTKKIFTTADIHRWGLDNYYISAMREARRLREYGIIRRLTEEEKKIKGFKTKQGIYEYKFKED